MKPKEAERRIAALEEKVADLERQNALYTVVSDEVGVHGGVTIETAEMMANEIMNIKEDHNRLKAVLMRLPGFKSRWRATLKDEGEGD